MRLTREAEWPLNSQKSKHNNYQRTIGSVLCLIHPFIPISLQVSTAAEGIQQGLVTDKVRRTADKFLL